MPWHNQTLVNMFVKAAVSLLCLAAAASAVNFQLVNNNPNKDVFIQILGTAPIPDPFVLGGGQSVDITVGNPWSGRIWGRTDCYSVEDCGRAGPIPATLAEVTLGDGGSFYDISLVDGYNIMTSMEPIGGHGDGSQYRCQKTECAYEILNDCPDELKLFNDAGVLVSCQAACNVFGTDLYCCRGDHGTPETCKSSDWPVDYASFFKQRCPDAYSYAYDDQQSTYTCDAVDFKYTFL